MIKSIETMDYSKPVTMLMSLFNPQDRTWMQPAETNMLESLAAGNAPTSDKARIKFRVFMLFYRKMLVDTGRADWSQYGGESEFLKASTDDLLLEARNVYKHLSSGVAI